MGVRTKLTHSSAVGRLELAELGLKAEVLGAKNRLLEESAQTDGLS